MESYLIILVKFILLQRKMLNIAIVHDSLSCRGGGEQVALALHKAYPNAPIFTLTYDAVNTYSEFKNAIINTSWFQRISNKEKYVKKFFFPLGIFAATSIDVSDFDIVLMSTTHCAKYVRVNPNALVICYAHNPFRLAWYPNEYKQYNESKGIKRWLFDKVLYILRIIDKKSIDNVDFLLTNSTIVKQRLRDIYDNYKGEINIIPPPVNVSNFYISEKPKEYFLVVSRLESYKKVDLVIEVFNEIELPLVIVGKGVLEQSLKRAANKNIIFLKDLSNKEIADVYSGAIAFIFPQLEDFGITPLEANASGVPVIAYGYGGVLDTQVPLIDGEESQNATAIFFNKQDKSQLKYAIEKFLSFHTKFQPLLLRKHAESFDERHFIEKIQEIINEKSR